MEDEQKRPVEASQSAVPHVQSLTFAAVPSVVVQGAAAEHELIDKVQKRPVVSVQSSKPQAQSLEFAALPSVVVQAASATFLEHLFNDDWQNLPSSVSHILVPHIQSPGLTVALSVLEQIEPVQHIHCLSFVQGPVLVEGSNKSLYSSAFDGLM